MAQTGYTPIQLYRTTTAAAVPLTANLNPGELAININDADMALYAENASGTVKRLMNNPAGLKYPTSDGTNGQVIKTDGAGVLSWTAGASGSYLPLSGGVMTGDIAFNAGQTFAIAGSSSTLGAIITSAAEVTTVSATAATGIINYDVTTQSVLYYTTSASANWTVNVRASSGTPLNTAIAIGQSITLAFMVTQGATAFYNNAFTIDGVSVTPKWQGGTAPTAGNAAGIDVYTYTITKTASATYIILASLTQFK